MSTGNSIINPYEVVLHALLHDIGKIFVRFAHRFQKYERVGKEIDEGRYRKLDALIRWVLRRSENIENLIKELQGRSHEEISEIFVNNLLNRAPDKSTKRLIDSILRVCDPAAAAERGIETDYSFFAKHFSEIKKNIDNILASKNTGSSYDNCKLSYDHYTCPYLLPTWILLKTNYLESVGPIAFSKRKVGYNHAEALAKLADIIMPILDAARRRASDELIKRVVDLLKSLLDEELWVPVLPLVYNRLENVSTYSFCEAAKRSSYFEVLYELLALIYSLVRLYGNENLTRRCAIDTLTEILRLTTLLVPAAVWGAIVPDTSLYAHSKYTAALASATLLSQSSRELSEKEMRLLVIDLNGIQKFVAAPVKTAAASRVLRGRSQLIELIVDSLVRYVLELFGGLPYTNIITSEGGSITILVPNRDDISELLNTLRNVCFKLSKELNFTLGFTIAVSRPFKVSELEYLSSLLEYRQRGTLSGFLDIIKSLELELSKEKTKRLLVNELLYKEGEVIDENEIEDLDSITREVVYKSQRYNLKVSDNLKDYIERIAGGKLSEGEVISNITHLSLIAGTCGRNLAAIISIYIFEEKEQNGKTVIVPVEDECILEEIIGHLKRRLKEHRDDILAISFGDRYHVGIIPVFSLGTIHILLSVTEPKVFNPAKDDYDYTLLWEFVSLIMSRERELGGELSDKLLSIIEEYSQLYNKRLRVLVEIKTVNTLTRFIPRYDIFEIMTEEYRNNVKKIHDSLKRLLDKDIEVSFRCVLTNTYHPATLQEKGGISLVDLDKYSFIALSKMDCDCMGSVKLVLSFSPSRLISFSEIVNLAVACKSYMFTIEEFSKRSEKFREKGKDPLREPPVNVIILYAGGDDVALYGEWKDVIYFVNKIYNGVRKLIRPLTLSVALTIDKSDVPILDLYRNVVRLLEEYAKKVKAAGCVCYPTPFILKHDSRYMYIEVFPLEQPSGYYSWPNDLPVQVWNLQTLAEVIGGFLPHNGNSRELEEYRRELYMLSSLGHLVQERISIKGGEINETGMLRTTLDIVELYMRYAYLWARREERLNELIEKLKLVLKCSTPPLLAYPSNIVPRGISGFEDAIRTLATAKIVLDLVLLAFKERELT